MQHWFFLFLEAVQPRDEIDLIEGVSSKERFVKVRFSSIIGKHTDF